MDFTCEKNGSAFDNLPKVRLPRPQCGEWAWGRMALRRADCKGIITVAVREDGGLDSVGSGHGKRWTQRGSLMCYHRRTW